MIRSDLDLTDAQNRKDCMAEYRQAIGEIPTRQGPAIEAWADKWSESIFEIFDDVDRLDDEAEKASVSLERVRKNIEILSDKLDRKANSEDVSDETAAVLQGVISDLDGF